MASLEASLNPSAVTIAETSPTEDSNLNLNMNDPKPKKTNRGRIKIAIEKIQNKNKKHVTFSKRRKGLFKKASELCVLCGVSVAIVTISEAGKVFTFGHPSADAVIYRYLHGGDGASSSIPPAIVAGAAQCKHEYCSGGAIENPGWDRPVEELGLEELESYAASLEQIRSDVERRITDLDLEYQSRAKAAVRIDFDRDLRLNQPGMAAIGNQMDNYFNMNGVGGVDPAISFVSPDFHSLPCQDRDVQYCGGGCMGGDYDDINSIVAVANSNRSNRGFAEFGEV